jgi:selenocysteine lyase/cysteine desulfurase
LNAPFLVELQAMGFNVLPEDQRGHHLVGVTLPTGMDMPSVQRALAQAGVLVSVRGASIRVAPHLYNDADDWARLMDVLKQQL